MLFYYSFCHRTWKTWRVQKKSGWALSRKSDLCGRSDFNGSSFEFENCNNSIYNILTDHGASSSVTPLRGILLYCLLRSIFSSGYAFENSPLSAISNLLKIIVNLRSGTPCFEWIFDPLQSSIVLFSENEGTFIHFNICIHSLPFTFRLLRKIDQRIAKFGIFHNLYGLRSYCCQWLFNLSWYSINLVFG